MIGLLDFYAVLKKRENKKKKGKKTPPLINVCPDNLMEI